MQDINKKIIFYASVAFLLPLLGLVFLLGSDFGQIVFNNYLFHSILLLIVCMLAFYTAYFAYKIYSKNQDIRIFSISLAFYIFGFVFLLHTITIPSIPYGLNIFNEALFDVTGHYGLFFGSIVFLGIALPLYSLKDFIYNNRLKIFSILAATLLAWFIFLIIFPLFLEIFDGAIILFESITPVLFLIPLGFLLRQYSKIPNNLLFYLILGFSVLISSVIIPFFYNEWDIVWWYFHFIILFGFAIISFGLIKDWQIRQRGDFGEIFGKFPLYSKISTKLIIFVLSIAIAPLIASSIFLFFSFTTNLERQILEDMVLLAESKEGHLISFLDGMKGRAVDFASDGFIRDLTQEIVNEPENSDDAIKALNRHLIVNKMSLDKKVYGINIIDLDGKIIASTASVEIGKDESEDHYFIETIKKNYGESVIGEVGISYHFASDKRSITASAPLTNKDTGERIGILVNYYETFELDDILIGEQQFRLDTISGEESGRALDIYFMNDILTGREKTGHVTLSNLKSRRETLDIYLVNKDRLMISESRFFGKEVFLKQFADTFPVDICLEKQEEVVGRWLDYRGIEVFGSSVCFPDLGWVLLVEVDSEEILRPIFALRQLLLIVIFLIIVLIIFLGFYISRRLIEPLEELTAVAEKISKGDLDIRANIKSKDEIGALAQNFNLMTDNLIRERRLPENILRSIKDSLFVIDTNGKITEVNEAALKALGYEKEEIVGKTLDSVFKEFERTKNG